MWCFPAAGCAQLQPQAQAARSCFPSSHLPAGWVVQCPHCARGLSFHCCVTAGSTGSPFTESSAFDESLPLGVVERGLIRFPLPPLFFFFFFKKPLQPFLLLSFNCRSSLNACYLPWGRIRDTSKQEEHLQSLSIHPLGARD